MSDDCIQEVFHSTVLAKLVYASLQMPSTNWTVTDAKVSITAIKPCTAEQLDKTDESPPASY